MTSLSAQSVSWDETASGLWNRVHSGRAGMEGFHADKVEHRGRLVILERLHPESFLIIKPVSGGYQVLGYSDHNLFSGHPEGIHRETELLDALASVGAPDGGRMKSSGSPTDPVGPLLRSKWGQGKLSTGCTGSERPGVCGLCGGGGRPGGTVLRKL
jgi:hypothetical protein